MEKLYTIRYIVDVEVITDDPTKIHELGMEYLSTGEWDYAESISVSEPELV